MLAHIGSGLPPVDHAGRGSCRLPVPAHAACQDPYHIGTPGLPSWRCCNGINCIETSRAGSWPHMTQSAVPGVVILILQSLHLCKNTKLANNSFNRNLNAVRNDPASPRGHRVQDHRRADIARMALSCCFKRPCSYHDTRGESDATASGLT
jgi:hypothetical protein